MTRQAYEIQVGNGVFVKTFDDLMAKARVQAVALANRASDLAIDAAMSFDSIAV